MECAREGKEAVYVGESSRSAYERAMDHLGDYREGAEDSHMSNHAKTEHGGRLDLKWKFSVIKTFQSSLTRQISEAVRIKTRGEDRVLNEKGVYNRCAIPEIAVTHNDKLWNQEKAKFVKPQADTDKDEESVRNNSAAAGKRKEPGQASSLSKKQRTTNWQDQSWGSEGETEKEYNTRKLFLRTHQTPTNQTPTQTNQLKITSFGTMLSRKEVLMISIIREIANAAVDEAVEKVVLNKAYEEFLSRKLERQEAGKKIVNSICNNLTLDTSTNTTPNTTITAANKEIIVNGRSRRIKTINTKNIDKLIHNIINKVIHQAVTTSHQHQPTQKTLRELWMLPTRSPTILTNTPKPKKPRTRRPANLDPTQPTISTALKVIEDKKIDNALCGEADEDNNTVVIDNTNIGEDNISTTLNTTMVDEYCSVDKPTQPDNNRDQDNIDQDMPTQPDNTDEDMPTQPDNIDSEMPTQPTPSKVRGLKRKLFQPEGPRNKEAKEDNKDESDTDTEMPTQPDIPEDEQMPTQPTPIKARVLKLKII